MKAFLLVAALLLAGCGAPESATVDPPVGTSWAQCPPTVSRAVALAFRSEIADDAAGKGEGIHRESERSFLYVYGDYVDTLREDRVTRVNNVELAQDGAGVLHVCTRVDVSAPTTVDTQPRTYAVAVRLTALEPLPDGPIRIGVNWIAGCPCSPLPKGNATALFE